MSPAAIVEAIRGFGLELRVSGNRLQARPTEAIPTIPEDLRAAVREHRCEVVEHLRREAEYRYREQKAIGSARPPEPHRRCPSCTGGLHPSDPDGALCSSCRHYFGRITPTRVQ